MIDEQDEIEFEKAQSLDVPSDGMDADDGSFAGKIKDEEDLLKAIQEEMSKFNKDHPKANKMTQSQRKSK